MKRLFAITALVGVSLTGFSHGAVADDEPRTRGAWAQWFLTQMEAPTSHRNLSFVVAWTIAENTPARFNPLATTYTMGANGVLSGNGPGVKNYPDAQTGLAANVQTVRGGYRKITAALRADNQDAALSYKGEWNFYVCGDPRKKAKCATAGTSYSNGIATIFQRVLQDFDAHSSQLLPSFPPGPVGPVVTSPTTAAVPSGVQPEHLSAKTESTTKSQDTTPGGLRMRYPLFLATGLIGFAGWTQRKRAQVISLFGSVVVMLGADAMSDRFSFDAAYRQKADAGYSFLEIVRSLTLPVGFGATLVLGVLVISALRRKQMDQLARQLSVFPDTAKALAKRLWTVRQWIGYGACWLVMCYVGAELGASQTTIVLLSALIGAGYFSRIPNHKAAT